MIGSGSDGDARQAMHVEERQLPVEDLRLGMYVSRLDRGWDGTPFPLQGVLIRSIAELDTLRRLCARVTIDLDKSHAEVARVLREGPRAIGPSPLGPWHGKVQYVDTATLDEELPRARAAQAGLHGFMVDLLDDLRAGRHLVASEIAAAVVPVVESVLRSADAVFWLNALRHRSSYEYSHALNCTALSVAFGRHLGFPEPMLTSLAAGGLMLDLGKAQLPDEILDHPGPLDAEKFALVRRHVEYSVEILAQSGNRDRRVVDMVSAHHERFDGSGYPNRLRGAEIPLFGRIAGLVDSFDAMTSERPWRRGVSHHEALQRLYRDRNVLFQSELVEQFTQCIGVYPTGSLVELSSGEVAIVMAQNRSRHLCPRVLVLTTPDKVLASEFHPLELVTVADLPDDAGQRRIVATLPPGAYGLDPTELYL